MQPQLLDCHDFDKFRYAHHIFRCPWNAPEEYLDCPYCSKTHGSKPFEIKKRSLSVFAEASRGLKLTRLH